MISGGPGEMRSRTPWRPVFGTLLAASILFSCAGCQANAGDSAALRQQAQTVLARWADAVAAAGGASAVVVVGDLNVQVGDWELQVGDNNKRALMAGAVEAPAGLSAEVPPDGEIRWDDGTTTMVPLLSAKQAVAAIASAGGACTDCRPLQITAARLTTGPVQTSRGAATAPTWEFTLQGTAVRLTRAAFAHPVTVANPAEASGSSVGVGIESATVSADGRAITVRFVGAPEPGNQPCGEDYTTEAAESDLAVVVIVTRHPNNPLFGGCSSVGAYRTATAQLAAPLGERAVLDIQQGLPVPVKPSP